MSDKFSAEKMKLKGSLFLKMTLWVFLTMFVSTLFVGTVFILLLRWGVFRFDPSMGAHLYIFVLLVSSLLISTIISAIGFRNPMRPIDLLVNGLEEIQKGNYDVRIPEQGIPRLRNIAKSFNIMAQELSSTETLRSDFVSSFSHEFKTPISSIKGFAKLLKNPKLTDAERLEYLDIIIAESERLSQLATNTLNITKIESMEMIVSREEYLLDEQIRQCIVLLEPHWSKKKLNLTIELEQTLYNGNEELMQQVWLNLLDNSIKFSHENGEIVVALKNFENNAIVTISDNGEGMDEQTQKRMFDKFFQGDKSRSIQGNGVGLSIVKKIVNISNGRIKVKSEPSDGTTITVILPLCLKQDEAEKHQTADKTLA